MPSETTPIDHDDALRYATLISEANHPDWPDMVNLARGYLATKEALAEARERNQMGCEESCGECSGCRYAHETRGRAKPSSPEGETE